MTRSSDDDPHFSAREFDILRHRPHKTAIHFFNAIAATAIFRIWPHLLFMGGWSTMVVLVNEHTGHKASIPTTMITVLGVLLGLTLSYRTSSAYEKYSEGRKLWSQITVAARNWARIVWIHCPNSLVLEPPTDPQEQARDMAHATLEKKSIVQLSLAFAVAVKHYLRGEEGILYDDLFYLVNFIPSLDLPSALPDPCNVNIADGLPSLSANRPCHTDTTVSESSIQKAETFEWNGRPTLKPSNQAPKFKWSSLFLHKAWKRRRESPTSPIARRQNTGEMAFSRGAGVGQNVPLEVVLFMSSWVSVMQKRKTIDVPTITQLHNILNSLNDALASLERILTTPIPWSYNAHIWEVSWIYCLALPFQLIEAKFEWVTIPAVVIVTYIVFGYASIAEEIENPFGYDKNDLNLGYFCREIIAKELEAITAQPPTNIDDVLFSGNSWPLGPEAPSAERLGHMSVAEIRTQLAMGPARRQASGMRTPQSV